MQIFQSLWRGIVVIVVSTCAVGLLAVTTSAQNVFTSGSTGADGALAFYAPPPGQSHPVMAYDATRQVVVLFGGMSGSRATWEWDNTRWTLKNPTESPSARYLMPWSTIVPAR